MWSIVRIDEADYGCEERMPGIPQMVLVSLESDDGRHLQFEMPDEWMISEQLNEGDEWPYDIENEDSEVMKAKKQSAWMDAYMEALQDMDEL